MSDDTSATQIPKEYGGDIFVIYGCSDGVLLILGGVIENFVKYE